LTKIYDKIFPKEPEFEDIKILHNSVRLSWIEPNVLLGKNNYNFDNFLPETKDLLVKLENGKSPLQKINCLNEIFKKITNIIQFNNQNDEFIGVDDSLPIFQYAVIKAQPIRLFSNYKYLNMYMNKELRNGPNDQLVTQIYVVGEFIKNVTYENFYGISKEQFNRNCTEAINNDMLSYVK
jgi:hypothetical protein